MCYKNREIIPSINLIIGKVQRLFLQLLVADANKGDDFASQVVPQLLMGGTGRVVIGGVGGGRLGRCLLLQVQTFDLLLLWLPAVAEQIDRWRRAEKPAKSKSIYSHIP